MRNTRRTRQLAKNEGVELTLDEAEAYLAEMDDIELDSKQLKAVAGGYEACFEVCNCMFDFD